MVTFETCRDAVRELPFGSATDEAIRWMNERGIGQLSVLNDAGWSKPANIRDTAANACLAIALPLISTLGVYYNLAAGTARAITAMYSWKQGIAGYEADVAAAYTHFATAGYDFAVGTVLGYSKIISAVALGLFADKAQAAHKACFALNQTVTGEDAARVVTINRKALQQDCFVQKAATRLTELTLPSQERPGFGARVHFLFFGKVAK